MGIVVDHSRIDLSEDGGNDPVAYGVFLLLAASDYMSDPEMGGGLIESKWTPWLLLLVGVGCIIENMGRKYTIIKK